MSVSLVMRAVFAATLCVAPAVAGAQAPQTKHCGDGTTSSRSYFACWGHGGVDTSHAVERPHATPAKHHAAEPVQAGEPRRSKPSKSTAHKKAKPSAHRGKVEHRATHKAKKQQQENSSRGWLPWRHKKAKADDARKPTKHAKSSKLPVPERPNGEPRSPSE